MKTPANHPHQLTTLNALPESWSPPLRSRRPRSSRAYHRTHSRRAYRPEKTRLRTLSSSAPSACAPAKNAPSQQTTSTPDILREPPPKLPITPRPSTPSHKATHLGSSLGVPDLHQFVRRPADDPFSVPRERDRVHYASVPGERALLPTHPPLRPPATPSMSETPAEHPHPISNPQLTPTQS